MSFLVNIRSFVHPSVYPFIKFAGTHSPTTDNKTRTCIELPTVGDSLDESEQICRQRSRVASCRRCDPVYNSAAIAYGYCSRRLTDCGDWVFRPLNLPFPLGPHECPCQMASFRPKALAGGTSMTDTQTDHAQIHLSQ